MLAHMFKVEERLRRILDGRSLIRLLGPEALSREGVPSHCANRSDPTTGAFLHLTALRLPTTYCRIRSQTVFGSVFLAPVPIQEAAEVKSA